MGFGRPVSRAVLGEPLRASVPLRLEAGESLTLECIAVEVYFGDDKLSPAKVQVSLVAGQGREASVQVRTHVPISEPVVSYQLTAGCQAKISRRFVELADPPGLQIQSQPVQVNTPVSTEAPRPLSEASARLDPPVQAAAVTSGPVAAPLPRKAARSKPALPSSEAPVRAITKTPAVRQGRSAVASTSPRSSLSLTSRAMAQTPDGRLELDPVEADAATRPDLRMSGALTATPPLDDVVTPEVQARRAAAAALWQAMNLPPEEVARDRQKLTVQERMLAQIQAQASQASVAASSTAVAGQPAERSGILYLVSALAVVGLGMCAALFLQLRRRKQAEVAWWQAQMQEPVAEAAPVAAAVSAPAPMPEAPAPVLAVPTAPSVPKAQPVPTPAQTPTPTFDVEPAASRPAQPVVVPSPAAEILREVSVEELIDLEQQAEFFVVLGQDDAAVDLLESHVRSVSSSPLPFLKLLEIFQRLGKRADYERVQASFNTRFNAHAPDWEEDLQHGHELKDYPGVVERLQSLWLSPVKAMEALEKLLTRPESQADTFELPAYRELLFLYAVARDLAERDVDERPAVDLVSRAAHDHIDTIPFDLTDHDTGVAPLMATRPIKAMPEAQPTLSLDLQLDDLALDVVKPRSSYGDVIVMSKAPVANEHEVEHIDLPGLSDPEPDDRVTHKP